MGVYLAAGAAVLGGLLSGAGSYFGGQSAASGSRDAARELEEQYRNLLQGYTPLTRNDLSFVNVNPSAGIPAAYFSDVLLQLGLPDAGYINQLSPLSQAMNYLQRTGLGQEDKDAAQSFLSALAGGQDWNALAEEFEEQGGEVKDAVAAAVAAAGYSQTSFGSAMAQFQREAGQYLGRTQQVRQDVLEGRITALQGISQLQQDFPVATAGMQREMERRAIATLTRESDAAYRDQAAELVTQANRLGSNPFGALARLEEQRARTNQDIREVRGLERAINILTGQQNLGAQALSALGQSVSRASELAAQASGQGVQGNLSAASLAAQQASDLNQLLLQQSQFVPSLRAGSPLPGQAAALQSQAATYEGQAIKGGLGALGSALSSYGTLSMLNAGSGTGTSNVVNQSSTTAGGFGGSGGPAAQRYYVGNNGQILVF
jgi:hypothetical protein